jgi:GNAT superfamily N-acetyltransferase
MTSLTPDIVQVRDADQIQKARALLTEYLNWVMTVGREDVSLTVTDPHEIPTFSNMDAELANLPGVFGPDQGGALLLATLDGEAVGCVTFQRKDSTTCELKRMYVRPVTRGQGIGRQLVQTLIAQARAQVYQKMILDSHKRLTAAHALYEQMGFIRLTIPEHFPDFVKPHIVYMELAL